VRSQDHTCAIDFVLHLSRSYPRGGTPGRGGPCPGESCRGRPWWPEDAHPPTEAGSAVSTAPL